VLSERVDEAISAISAKEAIIFESTNMIANARFHRWRHAQAFLDYGKRDCVKVALFPFWFLSFLAPQRSLLGNSANLPRQVTTFKIQTDPLPKGFSV